MVPLAMAHSDTRGQASRSPRFSIRLGHVLRRYFLTGLATLFPVAVTGMLVFFIFQWADRLLGQYLEDLIGFRIPGLGLLATVLLILLVGVFSVHFFGRALFRIIETWLTRVPLVRKIYPAVKQLAEFFFSASGPQGAFQRVVLVEYPRMGAYALAFVTNEARTAVLGKQQTLLTLLIPQPPSPLTGPIIIVPEDAVIPLTMSVEDALKMIVSGGIVASPFQAAERMAPAQGRV